MTRHSTLHLLRELRRIGLNIDRFPGFAATGIDRNAFEHWIRTLPTGTGARVFEAALKENKLPELIAGAANQPVFDDPDFVDPKYDALIAFDRELDRVAPPSSRPRTSWGL